MLPHAAAVSPGRGADAGIAASPSPAASSQCVEIHEPRIVSPLRSQGTRNCHILPIVWRPLRAAARRRQRLSLLVLGAIAQAQVRAHPLASLVVAGTASLTKSLGRSHPT